MDTPYFLLLAATAALATWGIAQILLGAFFAEKRKLKQRLASHMANDVQSVIKGALSRDAQDEGLPAWVGQNQLLKNLLSLVRYAWPELSFRRFLFICLGLALGAFILAVPFTDSLLVGAVAAIGAAYMPVLVARNKASRRQRRLAEQLPDALDFLCRVLKAGHSLSTGFELMGEELPQPIAAEFRRCFEQHSLGHPLEHAMREMARRVDSPDFGFFVTAVLIQRQTGGDLSEVLTNIASMVRNRMRLQQHVKAITAEGRLTGYILFAFPTVLFVLSYMLNPAYMRNLTHTGIGQVLLGSSIVLQFIGLFVIRRIVTVRV